MGGGGGNASDQQVEIAKGFALGIHPVTQEQWLAVMGTNPSHFAHGVARMQSKGSPKPTCGNSRWNPCRGRTHA